MISFQTLALIAAAGMLLLVWLVGTIVVWKMATGTISLRYLICEENGQASLSRFQFLIFTFVIAASLILLVVKGLSSECPTFPTIDSGVWALLGISGASYVTSKGVQKHAEIEEKKISKQEPGWPAS